MRKFAREAIPLADAHALHPAAVRRAALAVAVAAALIGLVLAAAAAGRHPSVRQRQLLPAGSNGIVVLDLSSSISSDTYSRIGATLSDLAATRGRYGLIIFSDVAYEALPPETPAEELRPFVRFFTLPPQRAPGFAPAYPTSPWSGAFSSGTEISTGLELARTVIHTEHLRRPGVVLVSDLDDDPTDLRRLVTTVSSLRRERISLHVAALNPSPGDELLFRRLLGRQSSITHARLAGTRASPSRAEFPVWLAVIALTAGLVLALNELWFARLTFATRAEQVEA